MKEMMPFNEELRLKVLKQYEILDSADEVAYDSLASLAATMCNAPMACICLVDEYRQWFKARVGIEIRETDRCLSFCSHVILKPEEPMIVANALEDLRFCDNDLVTMPPNIRFYAGVALVTPDGIPLGALAIMDTAPRTITPEQIEVLRALAHQVEAQFELRRSQILLRDQADLVASAKQQAEEAGKAKNVFLSNISHEFRTPINGIMGLSSLMTSTPMSKEQARYVETIEKSAENLLQVLSNILEFSKNEIGDSGKTMTRVDTHALVENIASMMRPMAIAKKIRFNVQVDDNLRQNLMGDDLKIQQVLDNLIGNALKFTKEGFVEVKVKQVRETHLGAVVRFEVKDSGIGIPKDMRLKIFDEFIQVEQGPERNYGGSGLGLTIGRQLTRLMGTQINVLSELGGGSTFWFDLVMPYEDVWVKTSPSAAATTQPVASKGRILVVEDNEVSAMVLSSMLESKGYEAVGVTHSEEAIRLMRHGRYEMVFLSVKMPDTDTIQAATTIRRLPFPACMTPIVAMSATVRKDIETLCKSVGINDFLRVPVCDATITKVLDRWLDKTVVSHVAPLNGSLAADERAVALKMHPSFDSRQASANAAAA